MSLEDIPTDCAYLEQKATFTCISLIQQFRDREFLEESISPVVAGRMSHFRMVLAAEKKSTFN
jgi:tRNA-(ms[2]io[6]A)-hydroxylase